MEQYQCFITWDWGKNDYVVEQNAACRLAREDCHNITAVGRYHKEKTKPVVPGTTMLIDIIDNEGDFLKESKALTTIWGSPWR
jgi:hypothetical protein